MAEKQKKKTKEIETKNIEIKPIRKNLAWSRGTPMMVIPVTIRERGLWSLVRPPTGLTSK